MWVISSSKGEPKGVKRRNKKNYTGRMKVFFEDFFFFFNVDLFKSELCEDKRQWGGGFCVKIHFLGL